MNQGPANPGTGKADDLPRITGKDMLVGPAGIHPSATESEIFGEILDELRQTRESLKSAYDHRLDLTHHIQIPPVGVDLLPIATEFLPTPPRWGQFLVYFLIGGERGEELIGDLYEEFQLVHDRFGVWGARLCYAKRLVCAIGPLVWNALVKIGVGGGLVEWLRHLIR